MSKEAVFTMKLETDLRMAFMAEVEAIHRSASQVMRELMRSFIQQQQEDRDYRSFLQNKVNAARQSMQLGHVVSNDDVEAEFQKKRRDLTDNA